MGTSHFYKGRVIPTKGLPPQSQGAEIHAGEIYPSWIPICTGMIDPPTIRIMNLPIRDVLILDCIYCREAWQYVPAKLYKAKQ